MKRKENHIISELPLGTKFYVVNGDWYGVIIEKNNKKYIQFTNHNYDINKDFGINPVLAKDNNMGLDIILEE